MWALICAGNADTADTAGNAVNADNNVGVMTSFFFQTRTKYTVTLSAAGGVRLDSVVVASDRNRVLDEPVKPLALPCLQNVLSMGRSGAPR